MAARAASARKGTVAVLSPAGFLTGGSALDFTVFMVLLVIAYVFALVTNFLPDEKPESEVVKVGSVVRKAIVASATVIGALAVNLASSLTG